ncbi:MAG: MvaI/BcnI family restriction endonuclease [Planctomycetia bacterium]
MPPSLVATRKAVPQGGERIFGHLNFQWLMPDSSRHAVSAAKIIYYPQYPEVRLSGFLRGSQCIPSEYLREKSGEVYSNRILFLGVDADDGVLAFLVVGNESLRDELRAEASYDTAAGLNQIDLLHEGMSSRERLIERLRTIHNMGWITGRRLSNGEVTATSAPQAVGYTLEAMLGISANGYNEPDFAGYEIKAMTVAGFGRSENKVVTVMTPEPDLGVYCECSVLEFLKTWGYADKRGRDDRQNFGGIYRVGVRHEATKLTLRLTGYDLDTADRFDPNGYLAFVSDTGVIAAGWTFRKLVECWSRKHAAAAYVPAITEDDPKRFLYGSSILVCEGTDFLMVLSALMAGHMYLDPAIKAEGYSTAAPLIKRRNQFRIQRSEIRRLYRICTNVEI